MVFSYEEFTLENLNIFEMPLLTSIKMASHSYCSVYTNWTTYSSFHGSISPFLFFQLLKFLGWVLFWCLLISPLSFAHIWVYYGLIICFLFLFIGWSHNQLCCIQEVRSLVAGGNCVLKLPRGGFYNGVICFLVLLRAQVIRMITDTCEVIVHREVSTWQGAIYVIWMRMIPEVKIFEHWIPSWWCYLGNLWYFGDAELCWNCTSLRTNFDDLAPLPHFYLFPSTPH